MRVGVTMRCPRLLPWTGQAGHGKGDEQNAAGTAWVAERQRQKEGAMAQSDGFFMFCAILATHGWPFRSSSPLAFSRVSTSLQPACEVPFARHDKNFQFKHRVGWIACHLHKYVIL